MTGTEGREAYQVRIWRDGCIRHMCGGHGKQAYMAADDRIHGPRSFGSHREAKRAYHDWEKMHPDEAEGCRYIIDMMEKGNRR